MPRLHSVVEVRASEPAVPRAVTSSYSATRQQVLSSAGTWGDFTRYLQLLPGVVWNTDMSNDLVVRGGNPAENLYVVDGIEIPNINHLAVEGTTGGFTSMIDTASIGDVELTPGDYDARYSSRLSSLVEIHTLRPQTGQRTGELDLGLNGGGGQLLQPLGRSGHLLLSAHRSVLNLMTEDIGLNGVPIYTNGLASFEWSPGSRDHIAVLSLIGADSIAITPAPCDWAVTLPMQTQYAGSRWTGGLVWQHTHSASRLSTVTASYSMQEQQIEQQKQYPINNHTLQCIAGATPAYRELTRDGIATLGYDFQFGAAGFVFSAGARGRVAQRDYNVAQLLGQQSPFSADPAWTNAGSFARRLATGESAVYAQASGEFAKRWTVVAGVREETFALTGTRGFDPRASLACRINGHQAVNASYSRSAQLPPAVDLLSHPENRHLRPIRAEQIGFGAELWKNEWALLSSQVYRRHYADQPESTEYPALTTANMIDLLGQQFVWLPLKSGGRGAVEGVETMLRAHWKDRAQLLGSASYARTRYAAADGVLRPGNFDLPIVGSGMVTIRGPWGLEFSIRDTYTSGRPYTPFDIQLSEKQERGIYDLTRVNALRGPAYNRLDVDLNRGFRIGSGTLKLYGGVENLLDRENFLGLAWESNCPAPYGSRCWVNRNFVANVPETAITQMPRLPSLSVRYEFTFPFAGRAKGAGRRR